MGGNNVYGTANVAMKRIEWCDGWCTMPRPHKFTSDVHGIAQHKSRTKRKAKMEGRASLTNDPRTHQRLDLTRNGAGELSGGGLNFT